MFSAFCTHFPVWKLQLTYKIFTRFSLHILSHLFSSLFPTLLDSSLSLSSLVVGFISFQLFFLFFFCSLWMTWLRVALLCSCVHLYLSYTYVYVYVCMHVCMLYLFHSISFSPIHLISNCATFTRESTANRAKRQTNLQLKLFNYPEIQILKYI